MNTARYRAIADTLRTRIDAGAYPVGSKLPSIAALMDEFEVKSLNTVRDAQHLLIEEGLLRAEQGVGVWVVSKTSEPPTGRQILDDLRQAQSALARAVAHLEGLNHG